MHQHQVQYYDSEAFLLRKIRDFIEPAMRAGQGSIVIATAEHLRALQAVMGPAGQPAHDGLDHCLWLDAHATLALFMVDGEPDAQRFTEIIGGLLHQVSGAGERPVRAFGEMVAVLYAAGQHAAALRLEDLWNELETPSRLSLLCAYPMHAFPDESHGRRFECVCAAHSRVGLIELAESATANLDQLYRTLAQLKQSANALERAAQQRREADLIVGSQRARLRMMESVLLEMQTLAGHDDLTGLANRRLFTDRLGHAVERAARSSGSLALLYLDLDDFKSVNDHHGHATGDELLKAVATRLQSCTRSADTLCRLGGDEFTVLMEQADAAQADELVARLHAAFDVPFVLADAVLRLRASIGLALFPRDAGSAMMLVRTADRGMYRNKALRKSLAHQAGAGGHETAPGALVTVESAAFQLRLSRPHVMKLVAERRFDRLVFRDGGLPLIPADEVSRVAREIGRLGAPPSMQGPHAADDG